MYNGPVGKTTVYSRHVGKLRRQTCIPRPPKNPDLPVYKYNYTSHVRNEAQKMLKVKLSDGNWVLVISFALIILVI